MVETLEPESEDSYFNWNFFDTILQQKEGYSSYVFEDLAKEFLDKNPKIKAELEQKKQNEEKSSLETSTDSSTEKSPGVVDTAMDGFKGMVGLSLLKSMVKQEFCINSKILSSDIIIFVYLLIFF